MIDQVDHAPQRAPINRLLGAGIVAATVLAYFPALRGSLLWDDAHYLTAPALRSLAGLSRIWLSLGATEQYYPVLHSAFWLEHRLWSDSLLGYHLVNVALHAASALLFVRILHRLNVPGAWLAGALFALHPVAVESVAQISEQKNTLSTFFYLLALLAYLRFDSGSRNERIPRSAPWYAVATFCFLLALLSKTVTATLPPTLLVILWWRRGSLSLRRDCVPLAPWIALGAAAGLFSSWVERTLIGAQGPDFTLPFAARVLVAGHAVWFYLGKLLWPARLTFIYPRWSIDPAAPAQYAWPAAVVLLLTAGWLLRRRFSGTWAALLCFVGALFPTLGFFNVYAFLYSFVADHWQYLAGFGGFALVAAGWARWRDTARWRPFAIPSAVAVTGALGLLTWRQSADYRGPGALYQATLARNPGCWMAHDNLGVIDEEQGNLAAALAHFRAALALRPDYPRAHNNLGNALARTGNLPAAIAEYRTALRLQPRFVEARIDLGMALRGRGQFDEAADQFAAALQLDPSNLLVRRDRAILLAQQRHWHEALAELQECLRLSPGNPKTLELLNAIRPLAHD